MICAANPLTELQPIKWQDLANFWQITTLTLTCSRPRNLQEGPWLPGIVRGAWGRQLMRLAEQENTSQIAARDIFFQSRRQVFAPQGTPAPFVISVVPSSSEVQVRLSLFGRAAAWRDDAFNCLIAAMEHGISLSDRGGFPRLSCPVKEARWTRTESTKIFMFPNGARLFFLTPVRIGRPGGQPIPFERLIVSMANRVAGLARWQGFEISSELDDWQREASVPDIDSENLRPVRWNRHSSTQKGRTIPMAGYCGALHISKVSEPLAVLLCLSETCFSGRHPSFGMGQFVLS